MKYLIYWSIFCLLLPTGCQSTRRLTKWSEKDRDVQAQANGLAQSAGLPQPTQNSASKSKDSANADKQVQLGKAEIAGWYRNNKPYHLSTARTHFEEALRESPSHPRALHGMGIVADLERNFSEAERYYQLALSQVPNDSDILGDLGYSYMLQKRSAEAEQYLQRAIRANPDNKNATKHLADVYAQQGKTSQAQETYAKILSPQDAQKALAESSAQSPASAGKTEDKNFLSKILPNSKEQVLKEDLERRFDQHRRQQEGASANGAMTVSAATNKGRQSSHEDVKQQLAAIDSERFRTRHDGPILIDSVTGEYSRTEVSEHQRYREAAHLPGLHSATAQHQGQQAYPGMQGGPPPMPSAGQMGMNPSQNPQFANASTQQFHNSNDPWSGAEPATRGNSQHGVQQAFAQQQPHVPQGVHPAAHQMGSMNPAMQQPQQQPGSAPPGAVPPWGLSPQAQGAFQQQQSQQGNAQGLPQYPGQQSPAWSGTPDPRMHAGQPQYTNNNPGMNQQALDQNQGFQGAPPAGDPASDPYLEASKAAARMGMGFGPGTLFPVYPSAPGIQSPGSSSYWNGAQAPAPARYLPTDVPPQDLRRAFRPEPMQPQAPQTNVGVTSPTTAPSYSQEQFGTASRYTTENLQQSGAPLSSFSSPVVQGLERQRQDVNRELSHTMSQVWGQGPMNSTVWPSGNMSYEVPPPQGIVHTQQTSNNGTVSPWPYLENTPQTAAQHELDMMSPAARQQMMQQQHQQQQMIQDQHQALQQQSAIQQAGLQQWGGPTHQAVPAGNASSANAPASVPPNQSGNLTPPPYRPEDRSQLGRFPERTTPLPPSAQQTSSDYGMPLIRPGSSR